MAKLEAERLLWSKVAEEGSLDKSKSSELLEILEYLPLAITQAPAYKDTTKADRELLKFRFKCCWGVSARKRPAGMPFTAKEVDIVARQLGYDAFLNAN